MNRKPSTGRKAAAALGASLAMASGAMPAAPIAQGPNTVKQSQARTERTALPAQSQARAAYGIQMLGGGSDGAGFYGGFARNPWDAPRYNQRKARKAFRQAGSRSRQAARSKGRKVR